MFWNFNIHKNFPEFLQPFRNLRIVTQVSPFDRGLLFRFVFGILLAWVSTGFTVLSSSKLDTGTGEMSLLGASSLARTGISPTVGEEGEDGEDGEE